MKKSPALLLRKSLCISLVLLTAYLAAGCTLAESRWETDLDTALAAAQTSRKNIFLLFTGRAWDGISEDLFPSIFDTEAFIKEAGKKYVLLHIDIPDIASAPGLETAAESFRLAFNMGVRAVPTALLVTKTGQPFAFLPMTTETKTAQNVLDLIRAERSHEKKVNRLYKKTLTAQGSQRAKTLDAYIEAVPERFHTTLGGLFAEIIEADPENKSGLLGKYKLRIATENAARAFHSGTLNNELNELLVLVNEKDLLSPKEIQDAYYQLAYFSVHSGKISQDEAVTYLRQAYNAVPDSSEAEDILNLIASLTGGASLTGETVPAPNEAEAASVKKD